MEEKIRNNPVLITKICQVLDELQIDDFFQDDTQSVAMIAELEAYFQYYLQDL